jgi:hypothetical protein
VMAVVSSPIEIAGYVSARLGDGRPLPTKEAPEIGRTYFCVPLFSLAGTGLFEQPGVEIQYFATRAAAIAWGEADIRQRRGPRWSRKSVRLVRARSNESL